jgi:hypothetical protein
LKRGNECTAFPSPLTVGLQVDTAYLLFIPYPSSLLATASRGQGISTQDTEQVDKTAVVAEIFATERNDKYLNDLVARLGVEPNVSSVSWEKVR